MRVEIKHETNSLNSKLWKLIEIVLKLFGCPAPCFLAWKQLLTSIPVCVCVCVLQSLSPTLPIFW